MHFSASSAPSSEVPAHAVPKDPTMISRRAGGAMSAAGLPPSMIMQPKTPASTQTTPIIVPLPTATHLRVLDRRSHRPVGPAVEDRGFPAARRHPAKGCERREVERYPAGWVSAAAAGRASAAERSAIIDPAPCRLE